MKKLAVIILMSVFALAANAQGKEKKVTTFNVDINCQSCIDKVEKNIAYEKGVKAISCDLPNKTVTVTYRADQTNEDKLKSGFVKIGYKDVSVKKTCSENCTEACCAENKKCTKTDCTKKCSGS